MSPRWREIRVMVGESWVLTNPAVVFSQLYTRLWGGHGSKVLNHVVSRDLAFSSVISR